MARLNMYIGDSDILTVYVICNELPVDLTDAVIKFTVKQTVNASEYLIQKSSTDPAQILITDAVNGVFKVYLKAEDTININKGSYPYDIEVTFPDEVVKTIYKIRTKIKQEKKI